MAAVVMAIVAVVLLIAGCTVFFGMVAFLKVADLKDPTAGERRGFEVKLTGQRPVPLKEGKNDHG